MFLTYGWYQHRWFAEEHQEDECTPAQRESVLQQTLAVLRDEFLTNLSVITDTGIVSQYFHECTFACDNVLYSMTSCDVSVNLFQLYLKTSPSWICLE